HSTARTLIYTLSLHDALPISGGALPSPPACKWRSCNDVTHGDSENAEVLRPNRDDCAVRPHDPRRGASCPCPVQQWQYGSQRCLDRKSTRLNSSHSQISYAVF